MKINNPPSPPLEKRGVGGFDDEALAKINPEGLSYRAKMG
jgi:hypothetical protein